MILPVQPCAWNDHIDTMKKISTILLALAIAVSEAGAQIDHWWKIAQGTKIAVKYFAPAKSDSFGLLREEGEKELASGMTKEFSDDHLTVQLTYVKHATHIDVSGTVLNKRDDDVCFTLRTMFPVSFAHHARWGYDLDSTCEPGTSGSVISNMVDARTVVPPAGAFNSDAKSNGGYGDNVGTGKMSFFPVASVSTDSIGLGWGVDMGLPLVFRLAYAPATGMIAEFDLATTSLTTKFPGRAFFTLHLFEYDAAWDLRAALEKYHRIQEGYFTKRLPQEGIWLPFAPLWEIRDWKDFGFGFHETNFNSRDRGLTPVRSSIDADKSAGVLSFQYTEPWEEEIPIKDRGMSYEQAATKGTTLDTSKDYFRTSAARDKHGRLIARKLETPWFPTGWAVSINTNPDPDIPGYNRYDEVRRREIDPALARNVDGIYFDCLEWHWQYDLNYNRSHFGSTDYPLTFSSSLDTPRPALWNYATEYEFIRTIADEMHRQGKYVMGNSFTWIPFSAGVLDVFGSELSWYLPAETKLNRLQFLRAMGYQKPAVFLLNEGMDDSVFTHPPYSGYQKYFDKMLLYGFYPSFFSVDASNNVYWADSSRYNQGRPFFLKYIPLIKEIAHAGWQPVTHARLSARDLRVERFGSGKVLYFAVYNPTPTTASTSVRIEAVPLGIAGNVQVQELLTGTMPIFTQTAETIDVQETINATSANLIKIVTQ